MKRKIIASAGILIIGLGIMNPNVLAESKKKVSSFSYGTRS